MENKTKPQHTPLYRYAGTIKRNWENIDQTAKPYINAMFQLDQITDSYGADTARSVVRYFLLNAKKWKGEIAKNTKKELKRIANFQLEV